MLVTLLIGLIADRIFGAAASMHRSFDAEIDRYVQERGLRSAPPKPAPAR